MAQIKSKSAGLSWGGVLAKLFVLACFPMVLGFLLLYAVINLIIDVITAIRESKLLPQEKVKLNSVERSRERWKNLLNIFYDYIKSIFSF